MRSFGWWAEAERGAGSQEEHPPSCLLTDGYGVLRSFETTG